ncbi:MAG TPA: hypothetical protein VJZ77_24125, partial [Blastocatellia bacterium]|nr:hypothetical protein [Blastocatellia bacterium]
PLFHSSICRQVEEWKSGVKAAALQSFAIIHALLDSLALTLPVPDTGRCNFSHKANRFQPWN